MLSIAVASVLAAPMSGWIIEHMNTGNYEGWRWLFAIEGIPTVLLGALTFYLLPDRPEKPAGLHHRKSPHWSINLILITKKPQH